ncbi:MAG TPA: response regulator transcription factor [Solirubrobacteraceae bacterium]|nr:response regulator transcription factor [Solirubrobacteraceae bacterium]
MDTLLHESHSETAVTSGQLTVLIADDHPLIIAGIRRTIDHVSDMHVIGEAHSGVELTQLVERRRPDIVLMDLRMPGVSGTEMIELIGERWPDTKTIVLSACDDAPTIESVLRAGASAYVLKTAASLDITAIIRQAASGAVVPVPATAQARAAAAEAPVGPALTERERDILSRVAAGMTTAAISRELWVSEHTIKFHLTNVYRKLGVPNRAGAVRYALEHGIG